MQERLGLITYRRMRGFGELAAPCYQHLRCEPASGVIIDAI